MEAERHGTFQGLAETIDHLLCAEFRRSGPTINDGVIDPLYKAARALRGGPLAWGAAQDLLHAAGSGGTIYLTTGHVHPLALPYGETDGPPGVVALARALLETTSATIVILTEDVVTSVLKAACNAAGLVVRPREHLPLPRSVAVSAFPIDRSEALSTARELVKDAVAVVAVEKIGPCEGGGYRTGSGTDVAESLAKVDLLFDAAREMDVLTVGIGDLGNEIGMAALADTVKQVVRKGDTLASAVHTTSTVVAACSNWGAYGVAAALAAIANSPEAIHTEDLEKRIVEASCLAGAVDGFSTGPTLEVDGAPLATHAAFVRLLNDVTLIALDRRTPERHLIENDLKNRKR